VCVVVSDGSVQHKKVESSEFSGKVLQMRQDQGKTISREEGGKGRGKIKGRSAKPAMTTRMKTSAPGKKAKKKKVGNTHKKKKGKNQKKTTVPFEGILQTKRGVRFPIERLFDGPQSPGNKSRVGVSEKLFFRGTGKFQETGDRGVWPHTNANEKNVTTQKGQGKNEIGGRRKPEISPCSTAGGLSKNKEWGGSK